MSDRVKVKDLSRRVLPLKANYLEVYRNICVVLGTFPSFISVVWTIDNRASMFIYLGATKEKKCEETCARAYTLLKNPI